VDSTRPPHIVVEQVAACRDGVVARAQLEEALAPALAPGPSWMVRAKFERAGGRLSIHGDVIDADDVTVASRTLSTHGTDCASLAKGLAVWASLVLDAEVDRAKATPAGGDTSPSPVPVVAVAGARPEESAWPESHAPDPHEGRPADADLFLKHAKEERTVELGLSSFVMGGTGGGAIVGPAAYGIFETAHGFFLRPTLLGGHTVGGLSATAEAPATYLGSRFDACARLPGLYREGRGLSIDLCGGAELGFSLLDVGGSVPYAALGPSVGIRGELGTSLSAIVRGVGNVSLIRDGVMPSNGPEVAPAIFGGRAEVGLSWTLR